VADLLNALLEILVAAALSLIGVDYDEAADQRDAKENAFLTPAVFLVSEDTGVSDTYVLSPAADMCEDSARQTEMPVFVGIRS